MKVFTWAFDTYGPKKVTTWTLSPVPVHDWWKKTCQRGWCRWTEIWEPLQSNDTYSILFSFYSSRFSFLPALQAYICSTWTWLIRRLPWPFNAGGPGSTLRLLHRLMLAVQRTPPSSYYATHTHTAETNPVMPYMMTKFLGHLGDKALRCLMLRVLLLKR